MLMKMVVDQIGPDQELAVGEYRRRRTIGHHSPLLAQDDDPIRDQGHDVQLVSSHDQRASRGGQSLDQIDEDPFGARIERGRRLVK